MNKNQIATILSALLLVFGSSQTYANSWRINNDNTKSAKFVSINEAMNSDEVADGDTLYLDPGCLITDAQTVTKQVVIMGCGYNAYDRPYGSAIISGTLTINAEQTKIIGMELQGETRIAANFVTLERCKSTAGIACSGNSCTNATIRQCYISVYQKIAIVGDGQSSLKSTSWTIENNILYGTSYYGACIKNLYQATIRNNLLISTDATAYSTCTLTDLSSCEIKNNIIFNTANTDNTTYGINNCTIADNVISKSVNPDYNQIVGKSLAAVLTGDYERYTLVENSPAADYGDDGKDCGIFGGQFPYVAGGLPQGHPYFTKAVIGANVSEGVVNVSLQIKVQDE